MMIGYSELDNILDEMIAETDSFSLQEAIDTVNLDKLTADELLVLGNRVARNLDGRDDLFSVAATGLYQTRTGFFCNAQFIVTPDAFEIENGILVPGHRFAPFCSQEIFPSEIEVIMEDINESLPIIDFAIPAEIAVNYHLLLGSEQMFDVFVAENSNNKAVMLNQTGGNIVLSVFDVREFLLETGFVVGDLMLLTVKEWNEGVFSITKISADERSGNKKEWIKQLSVAIIAADDKDADYMEISEQLTTALFRGGRALLDKPGASLDEFIKESETVQISYANGATMLGAIEDAEETVETSAEVPEGVTVSQGNVSDLNAMLKECGSLMTQNEIEAFILDQCWQRQVEFELLFKRCFTPDSLTFADDGQEAVFMNMLEDLWERVSSRYDRKADDIKAPVRERGLELVETRLSWLNELKHLDIDQSGINEDILKSMAEVAVRVNSMFRLLALDGNELLQDEAEGLLDALDQIGEMQEQYIEELMNDVEANGRSPI
jgi:hypothetical protein